ncbi:MAG: FAD-dependent oxidoreductase [Rhodospirillaceae bacterium]|nr:FAD-dependent oxidoreductase [Rhodospirillaceae bacterium]
MAETLNCDLCVIGAGAGGLTLAAGASQMGASVILVERARMGGECLYTGCVPSKALLAAAARGDDFDAAFHHVERTIAEIAPHDSPERFEGFGARVIAEDAHFSGRRSLIAGAFDIRARRYVIATGSTPTIPDIPGIDTVAAMTNETLFAARPAPSHLIVLGGGPVGIEMAQAFRRLGAEVSLVEANNILANDDPELVAVIRQRLLDEGVALYEQSKAVRAAASGGDIVLSYTNGNGEFELEGSHLLVAAGRTPNVDGLGLEAAGVTLRGGALVLDKRLRTTNRRIFAIGDVAGPYRFTHMAAYQAGIVLRNVLFRLPAKAEYQAVPWVTYADPELAHVGLGEAGAHAAGIKIDILRFPFAENDRAVAEGKTEGLIKVVVTRGGRILGASIAGAHAGELIHVWSLAVSRRLKVSAMAKAITPYPTLSEVSTRAAGSYYAPKLFSPRTKRIVRFLQRLG